MTRQQVNRTNQQTQSETPLVSGVVQRAAARTVPENEVQPTEEVEATTFRESRFQYDFSRVPITTTAPVIQAKSSVSGEDKSNKTGLPDHLKSGIENLSGMAIDDVRVHYNSSKPSQFQALAYTQGTNIHVAPGQEKHLPHEAWHVVQQIQGRVKPTLQMKGVGINDDGGVEREADVMGEKAIQQEMAKIQPHKSADNQKPNYTIGRSSTLQRVTSNSEVIQLAKVYKKRVFGLPHWEVVLKAPQSQDLWQVGFANPTAIKDTSGSVGTKSGSPSGYGGEGEVHWTQLKGGKEVKGGYQFILEDSAEGGKDEDLWNSLPKNGTREKYRLTNNNCQHFIVTAWAKAHLSPDLEPYLTISKNTGDYVNSGLLGGLVVAIGAAAAMGAHKYLSE